MRERVAPALVALVLAVTLAQLPTAAADERHHIRLLEPVEAAETGVANATVTGGSQTLTFDVNAGVDRITVVREFGWQVGSDPDPPATDATRKAIRDRWDQRHRERSEVDVGDDAEEKPSPKEVRREHAKEVAQRLREWDEYDLSGEDIGYALDRSDAWVYKNTTAKQAN